jgi:hypothetical protein
MIYREFYQGLSLLLRQTLYNHLVMLSGSESKSDPAWAFHQFDTAHIVPYEGFCDRIDCSNPSDGDEALVCGYNTTTHSDRCVVARSSILSPSRTKGSR